MKKPGPIGQTLPPSVTHLGLNLVALLVVLASFYWVRTAGLPLADAVLVLCAAVAVPLVVLDTTVLSVHRRETTGLDMKKPFDPSLPRIMTKLGGLAMTLLVFATAYWAFPEYNGSFYDPLYDALRRFAPVLIIVAFFYIWVVDGWMVDPKDAYWRLGRLLLGESNKGNGAIFANHFRGWLVKAFFFPLMFVWLQGSTKSAIDFDWRNLDLSNLRLYDFLYDFFFFIDLLFTTVGYVLSLRLIDTHIRTAEPTMLGWMVALFCYQPFYSLFERQYVHYEGVGFGNWLSAYPTLRWGWAIAILVLVLVYAAATVTFGVRFSNLTHRGILTNGPYRLSKHPAYISKNISWWMASVPFVVTGELTGAAISDTVRRCLLLGCLNFMYFMRAKTEERHLSKDPTYVAYAQWMNEHGLLKFLNRLPGIAYKPPTG